MALLRSKHSNNDMAALRLSPSALPRRAHAAAGPNVLAALAAGVVAGTVALLLWQWIAMLAYDESPWKLPRMMAALVAGPGVLDDEGSFGAPVALGFAVHFTLSLLYVLALAGQLIVYGLAAAGALLRDRTIGRAKFLTVPYYFCFVNAAALFGVLAILRGEKTGAWSHNRPQHVDRASATSR